MGMTKIYRQKEKVLLEYREEESCKNVKKTPCHNGMGPRLNSKTGKRELKTKLGANIKAKFANLLEK
jgi:hypothetical protein